jgi:hypothetical protein
MTINFFLLFNEIADDNRAGGCRTIYDISHRPPVTIEKYARRIYRYMLNNNELLGLVMYFIMIFSIMTDIRITHRNIYKLFLVSSCVCHKFWLDNCYINSEIAKIGGIELRKLNMLERNFLNRINWCLYSIKKPVDSNDYVDIAVIFRGNHLS